MCLNVLPVYMEVYLVYALPKEAKESEGSPGTGVSYSFLWVIM